MSKEVLRTEHVTKSFGAVTALEDVSIHLSKGEVLGLLGDNGAGKSTLMKILTGFHRPSGGKIYFEGIEIELKSVSHARSLGIEPVYQDLALVNGLNVYHNMFLQREIMYGGIFRILNDGAMRERAKKQLKEMGVHILRWTSRSPSYRGVNDRLSRSRAPYMPMPRYSCWTNQRRQWA